MQQLLSNGHAAPHTAEANAAALSAAYMYGDALRGLAMLCELGAHAEALALREKLTALGDCAQAARAAQARCGTLLNELEASVTALNAAKEALHDESRPPPIKRRRRALQARRLGGGGATSRSATSLGRPRLGTPRRTPPRG